MQLHHISYPSALQLTESDNFPFHFETVQAPRYHNSERGGHPSCCCYHSGVHATDNPSPFQCRPPFPVPCLRATHQLPSLHGESCQPHQVLKVEVWVSQVLGALCDSVSILTMRTEMSSIVTFVVYAAVLKLRPIREKESTN